MDKKGISLVEILVSLMIMALVMAGLANVFVAGKRYILKGRSKSQTAELGRQFLAPLQMQVRQDTWNETTNPLYILSNETTRSREGAVQTLNNRTFTPNYTVSRVIDSTGSGPVDTGLRRVKVTVKWDEEPSS